MFGASLSALALTSFMVFGTGVAQATPATHATAPQYLWISAAGYGDLWYNTTNAVFYSSHSNRTPLRGTITPGFWELWALPNGDCMSWYKNGTQGMDLINEQTCNQNDSWQNWDIEPVGDNYAFINDDASGAMASVCDGYDAVLTGVKSGSTVAMLCPASTNAYSIAQEWYWNVPPS
jgi:hypothetical protein